MFEVLGSWLAKSLSSVAGWGVASLTAALATRKVFAIDALVAAIANGWKS